MVLFLKFIGDNFYLKKNYNSSYNLIDSGCLPFKQSPNGTAKGGIFILLLFGLLCTFRASAQDNQHLLVHTPQNVSVRRTLPGNILPYGAAMPANFSANPTDEEIYRVHFFEEPLVPVTTIAALPEENVDLVYALSGYSQRKSPDDFSSILNFLKQYPNSRWKGALLANLGIVYRRTGYYSQALQAWQDAWALLKDKTEPKVKYLADRVVAELFLIYGWVGRIDDIDNLLKQIDKRQIGRSAGAQVQAARHAAWIMHHNPGISFKCGPYALQKIYWSKDSSHSINKKLMDVQSTSRGFSLAQLQGLSQEIGLNYQMAYREPGSALIPNAVINWKLNHYSVLTDTVDHTVRCQDITIGETYGDEFSLTASAFDSSASGYFLVPSGSLPQGWRSVGESEGSKIFGKGYVYQDKGKHNGDCDPQSGCKSCGATGGMAQSNVHMVPVSLHIFDKPLFYTPPVGPSVAFEPEYHQKDTYQTSNFDYSSMGPLWTFQWLSYVVDDPNYKYGTVDLYMMGGGVHTYTGYNDQTKKYLPQLQSNDVLVRSCDNCYELRHPDGSKETYGRPDGNTSKGRKIFLTAITDAAANTDSLFYDDLLRIVAMRDAIGQVTTLSYEDASDIYKITKVTDPFGRFAAFAYDDAGRLTSITDMIGLVSSFQYDANDFIYQMTTPYGITNYISEIDNEGSTTVETHYPLGEKERVEFHTSTPNYSSYAPDSTVPQQMKKNNQIFNEYLDARNTVYWDRTAMQEGAGDVTKATIYHWLHGSGALNEDGYESPILESIQRPLENRIWYYYQGQYSRAFANQGMSANPSVIGRVMDGRVEQYTYFAYNALGKITSSTDPVGRNFTYTYDTSLINLLEVHQTTNGANELLAQYTYNSHHQPLTARDASGQLTTFTYNDAGQLLTATNPKGETTTFAYDENGYLKTITGAVSGTTYNFSYDGYGRVRTVTDPEGYTVTTDYDSMSRPTVITYPDSTFEQIVYNRLDAVQMRDRLGRWTQTTYDSLDRPYKIQDALGRITQLIWCTCGSLAQVIDPLNHVTTFTRDLEGRLTAKTYNDGKTTTYTYEATTSRLKTVTDAKSRQTQFSYYVDDNVKQVAYANALIPTGSVSFTYDPNYNRVAAMMDTTGTTTYYYNPIGALPMLGAGQLASVDGPLNNDLITYSYDSLGRVNGRSINGVASSTAFDVLGRMTNTVNALGSFNYSYVNQTERLASIAMPHGLSTVFDYFDNKGDQRLKEIWNKATNGTTISKFDYDYNPENQITKWTQQASTNPPTYYEYGYDLTDQLTSATQKMDQPAAILTQYKYGYDSAGNRLLEHINNDVTVSQYNALNQLTRRWDADSLRSNPTLPSFPIVHGTGSGSDTILPPPVSTVPPFNKYVDTSRVNDSLTYDDNGNLVSSLDVTYGWDALDRLVSITKGTNITEFIYDGLSRRVAEKLNGVVVKRWLWDGTELAEERDADGGTVTKRFFAQGEQIGGRNYYFFLDHLGSVREMVDSNGIVQARYDYDPYGRRVKISGGLEADFGFTGYYYHAASGLYLTLFRAYDARLGRWLNRDPIEEDGGLNLYAYADNNPVNTVDPFGEDAYDLEIYKAGAQGFILGVIDAARGEADAFSGGLFSQIFGGNTCSSSYRVGNLFGNIAGIILIADNLLGKVGAKVITKEFAEIAAKEATEGGTIAFRYMTEAELKAIQETDLLRGGRAGETFFTKDLYKSAIKAQTRLSLPNPPTLRVEFEILNNPAILRNGTKVLPGNGLIGKGAEFMTSDPVEVRIINWQLLR